MRVLGGRLRLAGGRGAAERAAAVPDRDRRYPHRVRPRPLAAAGRAAADPDPRLARIRGRVRQGARAVVGPGRPGGRLPRGVPVPAWLRVQRAAGRDRLGRGTDRPGLGGADGPARVPAVRRGGQRLGHQRQHPAWPAGLCARCGHPPGTAAGRAGPGDPGGADRCRAGGAGIARALGRVGLRVLRGACHPAADRRLRAGRLPCLPGRLDRGEILVLDGPSRAARGGAQPGRPARQPDAVLAARHRRVRGPPVLGEHQAGQLVDLGSWDGPSRCARRLLGVPARAAAAVPPVGGAAFHRHPVLGRARTRRPFRRVRAAHCVRRRTPGFLSPGPVSRGRACGR